MIRLYVASSLRCVDWSDHVAKLLGCLGFAIANRWMNRVLALAEENRVDTPHEWERREILLENKADMMMSDAVVVLASRGDPRSTFADTAWSIAQGKPVVWVHGAAGEGRVLWDSDGLVTRIVDCGNDAELANQIAEAVRRAVGTVAA